MKLTPMKLKRLGLAFIAAAFLLTIGGAQAQQMEKIKVALHWNAPIEEFVQYYVAIKNGYYKAANLDVELMHLPGSLPSVTAVGAGDAQIGQASSDAILVSLGGGAPLKAIFVLFQQTPAGVIVFKESNIKDFKDLKGKTIATAVASPEAIMLTARLREVGLNPEKDVNILNVAPGAKLTMQLTGQADTSTGFADFQFIQAQNSGRNVEFIPFSTKATPLYGHGLVANTTWLEKHQDATKRFIAATLKGLAWTRDNVDAATDIVVKWDPTVKVDAAFHKRGWEVEMAELITNSTTKEKGLGHMETAGWANLIKMLKEGGVLKADIDATKIYTNEYIPADAPKW